MTTKAEKKPRPPRTKSQNGRRSRTKGADFEREVAERLRAVYPGAERCIAQARTAAREGCDVEGTPLWIECKVGGRPNVLAAMRQARRDRGADQRPVVVVAQRTREPATVTLELATFVEMVGVSELAHAWGLALTRRCEEAEERGGYTGWCSAEGRALRAAVRAMCEWPALPPGRVPLALWEVAR